MDFGVAVHLTRHPHAAANSIDEVRLKVAVRDLLFAIGEDPDRPGLADTPARIARLFAQMSACTSAVTGPRLQARPMRAVNSEVIVVGGIGFYSRCECHLLAFSGTAHVAYLAAESAKVLEPCEIGQLVASYTRGIQDLQRLADRICEGLEHVLGAAGAAAIVQARPLCAPPIGRRLGPLLTASALRGQISTQRQLRSEVIKMLVGQYCVDTEPAARTRRVGRPAGRARRRR
jgi:GTP cyclohydrolase IA